MVHSALLPSRADRCSFWGKKKTATSLPFAITPEEAILIPSRFLSLHGRHIKGTMEIHWGRVRDSSLENVIGCLFSLVLSLLVQRKYRKETQVAGGKVAYASPLAGRKARTRSSLWLVAQTARFLPPYSRDA